jgi:hypothetical protein
MTFIFHIFIVYGSKIAKSCQKREKKSGPKNLFIMTIVALKCIGIVITPSLKLKTRDCI